MVRPGDPIGPFGRHIETEEAYRGNAAVTNSSLNTFLWNEYWYQQVHVLKSVPQEDSPAFLFGRAFHCLVLEPEEFYSRYAPFNGDRRTKAYKEMVEKEKREVITNDEFQSINEMANAVRNASAACGLIDACDKEVVFRHMCNGNLARQCRVDGISPFGDIIDLKSCASIEEFRSNFRRYGYHRQARWYERLVAAVTGGTVTFTFIAVEKKAPYRCELFRLDQESCGLADMEIEDAMVRLENCLKTDKWRRNVEEVQYINIGRRQDYCA